MNDDARERQRYYPAQVEPKWRRRWEDTGLYRTDLTLASGRPKHYNLMEFPYPSAEGLHVGHVYTYGGADTSARFLRMRGYEVFEPMGFDAFGIHSENFALRLNINPMQLTAQTTRRYREEQLSRIGAMFDWSHAVDTSDPSYYRWTQWLFLQLFKAGLAVRKEAPVNWCPKDLTVLANEQVIDGRCERCGTPIVQRELTQWFLRITEYADRLLNDLERLDWPDESKIRQANWIGRSEGAELSFPVADAPPHHNASTGQPAPASFDDAVSDSGGQSPADVAPADAPDRAAWRPDAAGEPIPVFTTRPDTVFGATYLVLAPEHKLVPRVTSADRRAAVEAYVEQARNQTEIERTSTEREKTGVFTGAYAINPATNQPVPIWVADYVLVGYGTGAIMAVPAHDERDHEFALRFNLPIILVVLPAPSSAPLPSPAHGGGAGGRGYLSDGGHPDAVDGRSAAYTGPGRLINSDQFDGLSADEAKAAITAWLAEQGKGQPKVTYRLRDWLISRQRYWGPPIPIVYCPTDGIVPVPEEDLPVLLPVVEDFHPSGTGKSPLATVESFVNTTCPTCGGPARRETDVSDTFLDSSWYYLRYPSTDFDDRPFDRQRVEQWLPVDMYFGGKEHVVLHHLYSRFIIKALFDLGLVPFDEPFKRLRLHGFLTKDGAKISKSRGNVVNPDEYIDRVGADAFRTYLLFMGPYDQDNDFSDTNLVGVTRFLERVWRLATDPLPTSGNADGQDAPGLPLSITMGRDVGARPREYRPGDDIAADVRAAQRSGGGASPPFDMRPLHRYVKRLTDELAAYQFHTAIAGLMEYSNWVNANRERFTPEQHTQAIETLVLMVAPFAPFLAEEVWERLGREYSVHQQPWPSYDPAQIEADTVTLVVQVNGKVRDRLEVPPDIQEEAARTQAVTSPRVAPLLAGKQPRRVIYVPGRLINIVA